jgi:hypothetical protein
MQCLRCPAKQPLPLRHYSNNDPLTFLNLKQIPVLLLSETEILSLPINGVNFATFLQHDTYGHPSFCLFMEDKI